MIEEFEKITQFGEITYHDPGLDRYGVTIYEPDAVERRAPMNANLSDLKKDKEYKVSKELLLQTDWFEIVNDKLVFTESFTMCANCKNKPLYDSEGEPYCPVCQ